MAYNPDSHTIAIYQNKATLFKSALPPLLGGLLIPPIILFRHSHKRVLRTLSFLASASLLLWETLFLSSLFSSLKRLLFPRPIFIVKNEGIDYQPISSGFINFGIKMRWEEMAEIHLTELTLKEMGRMVTRRVLSIIPKDQEVFIQQHRLLRPRGLPLLLIMARTGFLPLLPEQMILPLTLEELLSQMLTHYQESIQANGIEVRENQKFSLV